MLGVLAGIWPSSLTPVNDTHMRVVIDSPAGEIAFSLRKDAAKRMWNVPEVTEREPDEDAARLRDQRLMQLAAGITPQGPWPAAVPKSHLRVTDRRSGRDVRGD
ncbi:hypothetical protein ACFV42_23200 [Streptomyces solisilvae]|uniref:hypothetical protein n=1 Tax=Streptomyces malaysiensis TaxID=92644 RepID=UPI0036857659